MRRIKLVLGVSAVMVAMLAAFAAPAMADDDEFGESQFLHPAIPILESALGVDLSDDDEIFWIGDEAIWTSDGVVWLDDEGSWSDDGLNSWGEDVFFV